MDFSLASSLGVALSALGETVQSGSLRNLAVFQTLEELNTGRNDGRSWRPKPFPNSTRAKPKKKMFPPPLAAYSVSTEQPFFATGKEPSPHFDEFEMQLELHERRLHSIQRLGWDSIRPIGVEYTLEEQAELMQLEALGAERQPQLRNSQNMQQEENRASPNRIIAETVPEGEDLDVLDEPPAVDLEVDLDEDVREDETSYDYDDEFARIDDEDEPPGIIHHPTMQRPEHTVQQFIETSHLGASHPYDVENNYGGYEYSEPQPRGDSEDDNREGQGPSLLPPALVVGAGTSDRSGTRPGADIPPLRRQLQSRRAEFESSDCE
ncbi:LADA_0B11166g1_1 [Lachancea dasiensis]|uniref:LADA_0B11166g1_1 n=1 Tax=Lachancea dasiensis TaxID=1072105 RepID=A0A1G4IVS3_9SACH|nr:LADA_0B11166g1_1 [Lachancea dasiensis]